MPYYINLQEVLFQTFSRLVVPAYILDKTVNYISALYLHKNLISNFMIILYLMHYFVKLELFSSIILNPNQPKSEGNL